MWLPVRAIVCVTDTTLQASQSPCVDAADGSHTAVSFATLYQPDDVSLATLERLFSPVDWTSNIQLASAVSGTIVAAFVLSSVGGWFLHYVMRGQDMTSGIR